MSRVTDLVRASLRGASAYHVAERGGLTAKLDANELPFALADEARDALAAHLAAVDLNRYPDPNARRLRGLIADELGVAPETLCFGNGSDEVISMLMACFGEPRPGDEQACVLYPTPTFSVYRLAAMAAGLRAEAVETDDSFLLSPEAIDAAVARHRPNLCFFARPNNPTGTLWPSRMILELAREHSGTLFVSDEAYADFGGDSLLAHAGSPHNLIVMRTLSKVGMAGLRIGFAIAAADVVAELEKVRPPYNLSALNLAAAEWLLTNQRDWFRQRVADVVAERERLLAELAAEAAIEVFPSSANLILFRLLGGAAAAAELWQQLADRGILLRGFGDDSRLGACLRVTIGTRDENQRFLDALRALLRSAH